MNAEIKLEARQAMLSRKKRLNLLSFAAITVFVLSFAGTLINSFMRKNIVWVALASGIIIYVLKSVVAYKTQVETLSLARNMPRIKTKKTEWIRAVCLSAFLSLLRFAEMVVYEFLPLSTAVFLYFMLKGQGLSRNVFIVALSGALLLALTGLAFWFVSVQKYSRARLILAAYPDITVTDSVKLSVTGMSGRLLSAVLFKISFLPWILLCVFVLPLAFVIPYYNQSVTCFLLTGDAFFS